ncbi:amino acid transporter [Kyrpidia spormannii]|uniref:Amino acid transporter n=1 Tax=Kyrpidia spormannii TaxID=2055160 RepID=A0A2K8N9T6_9BACL|nr:APC family permease [Kyrpidia spormannii]ATY86116.1 amino acid transporter [Kyrpidia spormannii]HHY66367.1 APC family permease [Alicyclobacillus sp.]
MRFSDFIGYDKHGEIKELPTTLQKDKLGTTGVSLAALGFNAPAWVAASSMSLLYAINGTGSPLAILVAYIFPMLVLALSLVYLTRKAPSAGGIFAFATKFLHPKIGTVLGWAYVVMCATVTPMTAVIGAEYIQALVPALQGVLQAKIIGTILVIVFLGVCLRGIEMTARAAGTFLVFEVAVVVGLGILGISRPHVNVSFHDLYSVTGAGGWAALASGVLFGLWMLANFDSAINLIEEAKVPVRTVQRSLIIVLTSAFVIYSVAAIGWQMAVPVERLAKIVENGNGGPIAAVAQTYLPNWLSWIAVFVVITSSCAGLQISLTSGSRAAYRMSRDRHLPPVLHRTNKHKAPWVAMMLVSAYAIVLVWLKPLAELQWYYDVVTITLVLSYLTALTAFIVVQFRERRLGTAFTSSILPALSIIVLADIGYTAGANPSSPSDLYNAWYMGALVIVTGLMWVWYGSRKRKIDKVPVEAPELEFQED